MPVLNENFINVPALEAAGRGDYSVFEDFVRDLGAQFHAATADLLQPALVGLLGEPGIPPVNVLPPDAEPIG